MKQSTMIVILVAVVIVVGGGAFYGGMKYGENRIMQDPAALFQQLGGRGEGRLPGGMPGQPGTGQATTGGLAAGGTFGTIQKIDGATIILSTNDDTIEVITSDTTYVQKMMDVGIEVLEVGESVIVTGSENADGTISARSIRSAQGMRVTDTSGQ